MNFLPFFFLAYLMGRNHGSSDESNCDETPLFDFDSTCCLMFGMSTCGMAMLCGLLGMAGSHESDSPHLSSTLFVLSIFIPAITTFVTLMTYELWNDHVKGISDRASEWALYGGALLTLCAGLVDVTGLNQTLSPAMWLLLRSIPAACIPLLLVVFDGIFKWHEHYRQKVSAKSATK